MSRFNRRFRRWHRKAFNTLALGVGRKAQLDPFIPIPELTVEVDYRTEYHQVWDKQANRFQDLELLYYKKATDPDRPYYWKLIDPSSVHSRDFPAASKKRRLSKV